MKSSEIREAFVNYFAARQHQIVASSSLIPANDPTLLFTNAGMVQFKDIFLGKEERTYKRAVSVQRCVRAGGKHNDLENVGYTARHHTFFEMLGNFSFGDYFKRDAISYAWDFLTNALKLPPERLWITVYKDDDEAAGIWLHDIGISPDRFSRCGEADNFWSMGDTGPCGPCSEIFYDHGPEVAGGPPGTAGAEGDRYVEIWNLVFMQYNRDKTGQLHPLPKPSVDTGMGLERITAVVQSVHNNYDIDSFQQLIRAIAALVPEQDSKNASFKVIADHIRASAFLIIDGVIPGNEGRGYVLRRIIRRALRHGNKLGLPTPFLSGLVPSLVGIMRDAYPELNTKQSFIEQVVYQEENQFSRTLEQGLRLLQTHISELTEKIISGEVVFKLYDTYGFPLDLTADIANEQGFKIDFEGFNHLMQQQRETSQLASQFSIECAPQTEFPSSTFEGYQKTELSAKILGLFVNGEPVNKLSSQMTAAVILDKTPFYAESGGQIGDHGYLALNEGKRFQVEDTKRIGQTILHYGKLEAGELEVGQQVLAMIDVQHRQAIRLNHTATHLLHAALKKILGDYVEQKGSLVNAERARFDFSYLEPLTTSQLKHIEALVNEEIRENNAAMTEIMTLDEAKKSGAVALFGEKYGDTVRVLSVGNFSKELCGGTHVTRTGDIGLFKIIAEYGTASGIRRIEFVTGQYALTWINSQLDNLAAVAIQFKTTPAHITQKLSQFLHETKQQEKELLRLQTELATKSGMQLLAEVENIKGINVLIKQMCGSDNQQLRTTLDAIKSQLEKAIIVLFAIEDNKINVVAGVSKVLLDRMPTAPILVKKLCGKGGGRGDMAQGGGEVPDDLEKRISEIRDLISEQAD